MPDSLMPRPEADAIVDGAFMAIFGRHPDEEGRRFYVDHLTHGRLSIHAFLRQLIESPEFLEKVLQWTNAGGRDATIETALAAPGVRERSEQIAALADTPFPEFGALIEASDLPFDSVPGQAAYAVDHRRRFHELFLAVRLLTSGVPRPRVLEFGPSLFSTLYPALVPDCRLVLADRPTDSAETSFEPVLRPLMATDVPLVEVDLLADLERAGDSLDALGPFDLVVFTEVLEHLARHPAEVLRFLLDRLSPSGVLYLTTPNALSRRKLHAVGQGRNPQQQFPRRGENADAHHHVREYSMSELIDAVGEAGGQVRALHFSTCWDDPHELDSLRDHPAQCGNLVVVAGRTPPSPS